MGRLDVWGVRDQTGSRDRFVDTDTGLTHTVTLTHLQTPTCSGFKMERLTDLCQTGLHLKRTKE